MSEVPSYEQSDGQLQDLLAVARRHTRADVSPRRHQASRAVVLSRLENRKPGGVAFLVAALVVTGGGGAFAGLKALHTRNLIPGIESSKSDTSPPKFPNPPRPVSVAPIESAPSNDEQGVKIQATPAFATIYWDDKKLEGNPAAFRLKRDGGAHRLRAEAPGYAVKTQNVMMDSPYGLFELELHPLPVLMGPYTSSSSIINADSVIESLQIPFRNCYLDALSVTPTLPPGKATISLEVNARGKVESAKLEELHGLSPAVATCLTTPFPDSIHFRVTGPGMVKVPVVFRNK